MIIENTDLIEHIAALLGVNRNALHKCLTERLMEVNKQRIFIKMNMTAALDVRDSLASVFFKKKVKNVGDLWPIVYLDCKNN